MKSELTSIPPVPLKSKFTCTPCWAIEVWIHRHLFWAIEFFIYRHPCWVIEIWINRHPLVSHLKMQIHRYSLAGELSKCEFTGIPCCAIEIWKHRHPLLRHWMWIHRHPLVSYWNVNSQAFPAVLLESELTDIRDEPLKCELRGTPSWAIELWIGRHAMLSY